MKFLKVFYQTIKEFLNDEPLEHASSIAFYTIFSMPAILIIAVYIASITFDDQAVQQNLIDQVRSLIGQDSAETVKKVLDNSQYLGESNWAKILGISVLIFSATTVFVTLQNSMNNIWSVKPKSHKGILLFFINRLLSLAMVISIGFLLLVSLLLDTAIASLNNLIADLLSDYAMILISGVNLLFSLGIVTLVFALLFKILPDAIIRWKDVWMGAFVTTVLFTLGKYLIGFYLGNSPISSIYGAAGSLVIILIWVYYSSVILLFGAEFTYVFAKMNGYQTRPNKNAKIVQEVDQKNLD